jgi:hypothetical protein
MGEGEGGGDCGGGGEGGVAGKGRWGLGEMAGRGN